MLLLFITIKVVMFENRLTTNNVLVAFEAFHSMSYGKVNNTNHFALKLDLSKAFDKSNRKFGECCDCNEISLEYSSSHYEVCILCTFLDSNQWSAFSCFYLTRGSGRGIPLLLPLHYLC